MVVRGEGKEEKGGAGPKEGTLRVAGAAVREHWVVGSRSRVGFVGWFPSILWYRRCYFDMIRGSASAHVFPIVFSRPCWIRMPR